MMILKKKTKKSCTKKYVAWVKRRFSGSFVFLLRFFKPKGVLRQLPFVSGLVNWFAPKENTSITGRAFNIRSGENWEPVKKKASSSFNWISRKKGKIETTESIYKYHMQVHEDKTEETDLIQFDDNQTQK
jgi:hypothetical protein